VTDLKWFESMLASLAPLDFPAGSVCVVDAETLPAFLRNVYAGGCLGSTGPNMDSLIGVASERRRSVIVLEVDKIKHAAADVRMGMPEAMIGVVVHEAAHLLTFPRVDNLAPQPRVEEATLQLEVVRIAAGGGLPSPPSDQIDAMHGPAFARALGHLHFRMEAAGVCAPIWWKGTPPIDQIVAALDIAAEPYRWYYGRPQRPLRDLKLKCEPVPRALARLFGND